MRRTLLTLTLLAITACASRPCAVDSASNRHPSGDASSAPPSTPTVNINWSTLNKGKPWTVQDVKAIPSNITVWSLQKMAEDGDFTSLNTLFSHALTMDSLPIGYAAGAGTRVFGTDILDMLTGDNWRGKIFYSGSKTASHGLNRIRQYLAVPNSPIQPLAAFKTYMLDKYPLTPEATSNVVILNYAHPNYVDFFISKVFDVMVAVPGKYGPVYIGKTWMGYYDNHDKFVTPFADHLLAWYFLDFNQGALDEQKANHWPGGPWDQKPVPGQSGK